MSVRTIAEYPYYAADGTLLAIKRRLEPKDFRWVVRLPDGSEKFGLNGLKQSDLPLFRLPELLASPLDTPVMIAEGEKDALTLAGLGYVATSLSEGAGTKTFPTSKLEPLRYRRVYIFADNDDAGRAFRAALTDVLLPIAAYVFHPELPDLGPKSDVTDWVNAGGTREQLDAIIDTAVLLGGTEELEPPVARPGAVLADEVFRTIKRYVVLSDEAARTLALWVMHVHAFDASEGFTPYIQITSPTRESGKTTLIDVLEALVPNPLRADSASAAAIYRAVDKGRGRGEQTGPVPTLFLDELDAVFGQGATKSEKAEALRGVLNSGFKRDGKTLVCDGDDHEPRAFVTYCPKVLAGIGQLPDTITSRAIPVPLARATREELSRLQPARAKSLLSLRDLAEELGEWARRVTPRLVARDEPVLGLKARHDDVWGPLLNIAHECGGEWPALARHAARVLHEDKGDTTDGRDAGVALLADLRDLFDAEGSMFITSARLAELLRGMEGRPWPEYSRGMPITVHAIARLLRPFGIEPRKERTGMTTVRAYLAAECREAFRRYLPQTATTGTVEPLPSENACSGSGACGDSQSATGSYRTPAVPIVSIVPVAAGGAPLSWDPDPEGVQPLPF